MSKLNTKHQIMILSAIFVMMVALFYFFAWSPQMASLDDLKKQSQAEEVKQKAAQAKLAMLSEVKKNAANAEVELIKIQNKMPTEGQLPSLIVELQNMSNDAGVSLMSIRPSEPKSMGDYSTIDISFSVTGSYVTLIDFLRRIEKAPRAMTVSSIDISVSTYPDLVLNLTLSAYVMGAVQAAPAPTPATPAAAPPTAPQAPVQTSSIAQPTAGNVASGSGQVAATR